MIVDLAAEAGGNCELTEPGETVVRGRRDDRRAAQPARRRWPSTPRSCTRATCQSLLELMVDEGELELDFDDEVIAGACITRDGEIVHEGAQGRGRRRHEPRSLMTS